VKTNRFALVVLSFVLLVSMASCGKPQIQPTPATGSGSQTQSTNPVVQTSSVPPEATPYLQVTPDASSGRVGTQYWKGTFPDSFYILWMIGPVNEIIIGPAVEISGLPWMILTYDKISGDITSVDFGMTEVTYKMLDDRYLPGFEYPANLDASNLPEELGLTGPIWGLVSSYTLAGDTINMGVQQFSFLWSNGERWTFNYTSDQMTGGVENLDPTTYLGRQSKTNAFHLYRISNGR